MLKNAHLLRSPCLPVGRLILALLDEQIDFGEESVKTSAFK